MRKYISPIMEVKKFETEIITSETPAPMILSVVTTNSLGEDSGQNYMTTTFDENDYQKYGE